MLDDVLRWLVGVTGLEPRLLTLTAIMIVYAASIYLSAKEKAGVASVVTPAQPVELGELASSLARVEHGVETVAKYLVNLENGPSDPRFQLRHEYEAFLPPDVAGAPPRNHHRPENGLGPQAEGLYFPVPGLAKRRAAEVQPGFFDLPEMNIPLPVIQEPLEPEPQHEPEEPPQVQPSPAVRKTLKIMSRKAGRTP